jgi:metal-responsive CopG/Arc/MetJ family transcriptional regulator
MSITIGYIKSMKTAISVPENVFKEVDAFAKQHHYSRSEVFVRAVKELLEKKTSRELLYAINKAYAGNETKEDVITRKKGLKHLAVHVLKEEKY